MKQKFVPVEKMSKKAQKAYYAKQRNTWDMNPSTKVVPDKHREKRDKERFDFS